MRHLSEGSTHLTRRGQLVRSLSIQSEHIATTSDYATIRSHNRIQAAVVMVAALAKKTLDDVWAAINYPQSVCVVRFIAPATAWALR